MISLGIAAGPDQGRALESRGAYSDAIVEALIARAAGSSGPLSASVAAGVGAVQGGASLYALAFAGIEVDPRDRVTEALEPAILSDLARQIVTLGEVCYLIDVSGGRVSLYPMSGVTVNGSRPDRSSWTYEGIVAAPDASWTGRYPAGRVIHCQWSFDSVRPWIGVSPLQRSTLSAELLAGIERGLSSELARESRYVLPIPVEPNRSDFEDWVKDLRASKAGSLILGKTMMGAGAGLAGASPQRDFGQKRLGPEPDRSTVDLRGHVAAHVLMAMGVDPALANPDPKTGALQAAYRSFLTGSASSLARIVTRELRRKLERDVRLRFAADVDNRRLRAAAVKALVDAGVKLDEALRLAGFDFQGD